MSSLPCLVALHTFDAASRLNSVPVAASEHAVTPSAVSRRIGNLEGESGVSLPTCDGGFVRPVDESAATEHGDCLLTPRGERQRRDTAGFRSWLLREMAASLGRGGGRRRW
ncbi:MAG: LysR family transcriptional regulator [Rhodospirillales bacterium]|nr:LysR family transcriptional regulator [Rhodospirillales bacterium]